MAEDTITIKLRIGAEFPTLQELRQAFGDKQTVSQFQDFMHRAAQKGLQRVSDSPVELETEILTPTYQKPRKGSIAPIPCAEDGILTWYDPYEERTNEVGKVGSPDWFDWLDDPRNTSFRYISKHKAAITVRRNGRGYWIAHKRLDKKLRRKYLGQAHNLTKKKLDAIAFELAQRELV